MNPLTINFIFNIRKNFKNQGGNYQEEGLDIEDDGVTDATIGFGIPHVTEEEKFELYNH